ncbi:MAG: OB-fold putative lipoprotein [Candidatus Adiutrix sp.]|nr:OB-fold putative lipoprotein [Candidatus Adiutrix sp.]
MPRLSAKILWLPAALLWLSAVLFPAAAEAQRYYMEPLPVTPGRLMLDFQEDFHSADAKYTGKLLLVTGRIRRITPPERIWNYHPDKLYAFITMDTGLNLPLAVYFWNWEAQKINARRTGATITVLGFCQGVPPQLSLVDACVYPDGCGGPVPKFEGPYYKLPPTPQRRRPLR